MTAYYNENDPFAAQWLRNLIAAGHIAAGDVDGRSIRDVAPEDLKGYTQCHFFAGIGGWSYALRLAGWPDNKPVWTGSCPCQPFSAAGKQKGVSDERHLWPDWFRLIRECKPPIIFGEQVSAAIRQGWLDLVFSDLEGQGYACGASVLSAASVGAPHIRQRLWFVADAESRRGNGTLQPSKRQRLSEPLRTSIAGQLADAECHASQSGRLAVEPAEGSRAAATRPHAEFGRCGVSWDCDWLPCTDGKWRPVEPGTFPLAHGIPGRVGRLRAYGNAIVPQVAAEFIKAVS